MIKSYLNKSGTVEAEQTVARNISRIPPTEALRDG